MHTGEEEVVFHQALEQATALVGALQAEHFVVSAKSTIVSSSPQLAGRLQKELATKGILLQVAEASRDLGADFAGGARRRITIQSKRIQNVKK